MSATDHSHLPPAHSPIIIMIIVYPEGGTARHRDAELGGSPAWVGSAWEKDFGEFLDERP